MPFHRQGRGLERLLSICLLDAEAEPSDLNRCDWSNALPIDDVGEMNILCRLSNQRQVVFVNVEVQSHGPMMQVHFFEQPNELAPYRVDNLSSHPVLISQSPCSALQQPRVIQEVLPLARAPFAWEQVVRQPTLDLHAGSSVRRLCVDNLDLVGSVRMQNNEAIRYRMLMDGPVKVLQILPVHPPGKAGSSTGTTVAFPSASQEDDGRLRLHLVVNLARVGISLVSEECRELLYATLAGTSLGYQASRGRDAITLRVGRLQIDNQLQNAAFPVLLRSVFNHEESRVSPPASLELLVQRRIGAAQVMLYETVSLRVHNVEVMLDVVLVQTLLLFAISMYVDVAKMLGVLETSLIHRVPDEHGPKKVYLRWLNIQPLRLLFSCRSVAGGRGFEEMLEGAPPAALGILNSVSAILSNIDRAPLMLKALVLDNTFAPPNVLLSNIVDYYREQLLQQVAGLVPSQIHHLGGRLLHVAQHPERSVHLHLHTPVRPVLAVLSCRCTVFSYPSSS